MSTVEEQLQELYESLPGLECKGLCQNACGPLAMSQFERARIAELGVDIPDYTTQAGESWRLGRMTHQCPALVNGRCSVYEVRPLVCRIWGSGRGDLACVHGCRPEGVRLRAREVLDLLFRSYEIGGPPPSLDVDDFTAMRAAMSDPTVAPLMAEFMLGDMSVGGRLVAALRQFYRGSGYGRPASRHVDG